MADRPFFIALKVALTGNGQGSIEYDVGQGNRLEIKRIQQVSTAGFDIIDIADTFGNRYTNASLDTPLDGTMFEDIATDNNNPADLLDPIIVESNGKIQFTLKDTSGSTNTVQLFLTGYLSN